MISLQTNCWNFDWRMRFLDSLGDVWFRDYGMTFKLRPLFYRVAYQPEKEDGSNNDKRATKMPFPLLPQWLYFPPLVKWLLPRSRGLRRVTKEVCCVVFRTETSPTDRALLIEEMFLCFSSHPQEGVGRWWSQTSAGPWGIWYPGWCQAHCSAGIKCFQRGRLSCWINANAIWRELRDALWTRISFSLITAQWNELRGCENWHLACPASWQTKTHGQTRARV